jgi:type II secretion system protein N
LVAVFVAATFPYDLLQARILAEASGRTGIEITADRWELDWPFGLTWRGVSLSAGESTRVSVGELRIRFKLASVLSGRPAADVVALLDGHTPTEGGGATFQVTAASWSGTGVLSVTGHIDHWPLAVLGVPAVRGGHLSISFTQRWDGRVWEEDAGSTEGTWTAQVADGAIVQIASGQVPHPSVTLARAKMTLQCRAAVCRIQELSGEGPDGACRGEGQVSLQRPLHHSTLALSISLTPSPAFAQRATTLGLGWMAAGVPLRVSVSGTIAQPQFTFM